MTDFLKLHVYYHLNRKLVFQFFKTEDVPDTVVVCYVQQLVPCTFLNLEQKHPAVVFFEIPPEHVFQSVHPKIAIIIFDQDIGVTEIVGSKYEVNNSSSCVQLNGLVLCADENYPSYANGGVEDVDHRVSEQDEAQPSRYYYNIDELWSHLFFEVLF